jgi:hypothetical protein
VIIFVAAAIGIAIVVLTLWSIRFIAAGPPPEPDATDVREVDIPFLCTVCGLSLTITQTRGGDVSPPRHCREDMVEA